MATEPNSAQEAEQIVRDLAEIDERVEPGTPSAAWTLAFFDVVDRAVVWAAVNTP